MESLSVGVVHSGAINSPVGKSVISGRGGIRQGGDTGVVVKGLIGGGEQTGGVGFLFECILSPE